MMDKWYENREDPELKSDESFSEIAGAISQGDMVSISHLIPRDPQLAKNPGDLWITETSEFLGMNTCMYVPLNNQL